MSSRSLRAVTLVAAGFMLVLAAGLFTGAVWATRIWPWPDAQLSYVFLSSILVAVAVPAIWIGLSGEFGATAPGAINFTVITAGLTASLIWLGARQDDARTIAVGVGSAALCLVSARLFAWSHRLPLRDPRPMPGLVRLAFVVFMTILIAVGVALVFQVEGTFPWSLDPTNSTVFGWMFLGAACYFAYGVVYPRWSYAVGQLLGFLAYDLVLIAPYLRRLIEGPSAHQGGMGGYYDYGYGYGAAAGAGDHRLSLVVYLTVITISGVLAIAYLGINPRTRLWRGAPSHTVPFSMSGEGPSNPMSKALGEP